jgi:glycerol-3-phosphate dehydrogenase
MAPVRDIEVAVIGAGVVGCAVALALARRGAAVALLEAEAELALGASGTNSGILHTGFDSTPGELETDLILASAAARAPVLSALAIPALRCGALMRPFDDAQREAVAAIPEVARQNGVRVVQRDDGALEFPDEAVTDPVAFAIALATEAEHQGAQLYRSCAVDSIQPDRDGLAVHAASGVTVQCRTAINCAGLEADSIARLVGDESFSIYPRKGEFLVFDPPAGERLERILLPVPTERTRGVLVFPTIDGKIIAGPTAVDLDDKSDWSVRPEAREEIVSKAAALDPPLADAEPVFAYAGLRPAGRGANYVIGPSPACPRLVHAAAIRSTGLSASLGIAERVTEIVGSLGAPLAPEAPLHGGPPSAGDGPWWRRTADYRAQLTA